MPEPNDTTPPIPKLVTSDDSAVAGQGDETSAGKSGTGPAGPIVGFGPPEAPNEVGTLGVYRIVRKLGEGNMGAVYLALDTHLNRWLALKVMLTKAVEDPTARDRFLREARAAAQLAHDNVVTVLDAGERNGIPFIAMQLLQGRSLDDFLKSGGKLDLRQALRVARETALALVVAHEKGLIHRDIKPANLWLEDPGDRVKVLDFGLAKQLGSDPDLTRTGVPIGTPRYMSPEQARGLKVDHRSDLFSLGSVLYLLCTGKYAFDGPHTMAVLTALIADDPAPAREANAAVPEPVAKLIHQLLAKNPTARVQTAREVVARVDAILASPPFVAAPPARPNPPPPPTASRPRPAAGTSPPAPPNDLKKVDPRDASALSPLERLATGKVTIDELLQLSADPQAAVPLWVNADEIWPVVKAAALTRADVRKAFRDLIAKPERLTELWDEATAAIVADDRRAWTVRWAVLREVARAEAKAFLDGLLDNESVVRVLTASTQTRTLLLLACAEVGLPPPGTVPAALPPAPPPAAPPVVAVAAPAPAEAPSRSGPVEPSLSHSKRARESSIAGDQFYVTYCMTADSVLNDPGYTVRAASNANADLLDAASRFPPYELPIDMWKDRPAVAGTPRRLAYVNARARGFWAAHSVYLAKDAMDRDHAHFTHLFHISTADPAEVLRSWGGDEWVKSYPQGAPKNLPGNARLPAGTLVSDEALTAFLGNTPPGPTDLCVTVCPARLRTSATDRRDVFARVLQAVLLLDAEEDDQRRRLYIHAEPGVVALLLYGAIRLLPPDMTENLTFSTFEPYHRNFRGYKLADVVGTYLGSPSKGLDPDLGTTRGIALDTFAPSRSSPELRRPVREALAVGVGDLIDLAQRGEWAILPAVRRALGPDVAGLARVGKVLVRARWLDKVDSGSVSITELLTVQENPSGAAELKVKADKVWPVVKEAALDPRRTDVRAAFRDLLSESDRFKEVWEEAVAALLKEDFRSWDARWVLLRDVPGREEAKKLLKKLVGSEKNEERLSRLRSDVRARMRSACIDVALLPPRPLLVPIGLGELEPLLTSPPDWAGYTAFVLLANDGHGWLAHVPAPDRARMRTRAREFLLAAPTPAIAAYVHAARPYLDSDPAFLEVLFKPYSPACAALMDKLLTTTTLEPGDWMKMCVHVGLTQDQWGDFLLEKERLANLLVGLGGEGTGKDVWAAYLGLLTPGLVSPDLLDPSDGTEPSLVHAWERNVHHHLKTAAEHLTVKGIRVASALPQGGVARLFAANNLIKWVDNPATAERDGWEEVKHACELFEIDRLALVRVAYKKGGYDRLALPEQNDRLEPIVSLFRTAFPVDAQYHTARIAVSQWLKLSQDCPTQTRGVFQAHFVVTCVPRAHYAALLDDQRQYPFEPRAEAHIRHDLARAPAPGEEGAGPGSKSNTMPWLIGAGCSGVFLFVLVAAIILIQIIKH